MNIETIELSADDARVPLAENRPFASSPAGSETRPGALLVHGFTGSPWEMRPVARHLAGLGISSLGIRLPGHGTSAEDLTGYRLRDWLGAVRAGYEYLENRCSGVIGIGLSTGAMLLLASHRQCGYDSLVLISPYLRFRHLLAPYAGILRHLFPYHRRPIPQGDRPYYYSDRPLAGIAELNRLIRRVRPELPAIASPTLVACADGDRTIDPDSTARLYARLGSSRKEFIRYGRDVPHVMTADDNPQREDLFCQVGTFLNLAGGRES